ncbi:MAG: hypothetical protein CBC49_006270 [Alphaproteobacteria bacterium TMED89]|nr:MAG: hypothetical protein CBC49_006270 [Alphaproteobacteria bacterium TMED89]
MPTGYRASIILWLQQILKTVAVAMLVVSLAATVPVAKAQTERPADRLSEQERRINGLVKTGRAMLTNQQYARAYKHFLTYARQEPDEARLYRWLVLSSLYADRKDALTELMLDASEQSAPTTKLPFDPNLADYALAELAMSEGNIDAVRNLLEDFPSRNAPSPVLVLQGQVALLESDFVEADRLAELAQRRDANDPEANRLAQTASGLNAMTQELGRVVLDPAGYDFLDMTETEVFAAALLLPYQPAILQEEVGTQLIEAYLSIGSRNPELRLLIDVFRQLTDLSNGGVEGLMTIDANVNELAAKSPDFAESASFLQVLELIGRFWLAVREYDRAYDTFDQIQRIQEQRGDATAQSCTLVVLGRTATLMGRRDDAKNFRDSAREITEAEAQKTRAELVRPWGQFWPFIGVAALAVLTLLSLVGSRIIAPTLITPLRQQAPQTARMLSNQTTRRVWVAGLYFVATLVLMLAVMAAISLGLLLLDWAAVEVFKWRDSTLVYNSLYEWTDAPRLASVSAGFALMAASVAIIAFASTGQQDANDVAERIDTKMRTGGSLEAFVSAVATGPASALQARNPALTARAKAVTARGIPGWIFPFALSPLLFAGGVLLLGGVLTGYRYLPTPDQPTPPLCDPDTYVPPPFLQASQQTPQQQQSQAPMAAEGEGETGLDVSDSEVPDGALDDLLNEQSVGGLDDAGDPLDYYTGLPDRQFNIDRTTTLEQNRARSGSYLLDDTGLRPRQSVPERYRGRWD